MKITVPRYVPHETDPRYKGSDATLGETGNAQYGNVFDPIVSQLRFETRSFSEYDPESFDRVEEYIEKNGLGERDAKILRKIGIGSEDNFNAAISHIERMSSYEGAVARSTNGALLLTDPALHFSFILPASGSGILKGGTALAKRAPSMQIAKQTARQKLQSAANNRYFDGDIKPINNGYERLTSLTSVVSANAKMRNKKLTASELGKISALDAAVADGTISFSDALTEISYGEDPLEELQNAAIYTTAMTTLGYGAGYGLGAAMGAPLKKNYASIRNKTVSQNYKEYLNSVSDRPAERGEDLSFTGKWFTESWFMKAVPTPVRDAINDKLLPEWAKKDLLILAGDNGMPFVMNQKGDSVGSSVYTNAGRRQGDWYAALEVIEQNYAKVSPRGNAKIANVPVGEYVEKARRKIGKDSFAPDEWYNHIGRLVIDEVPYDKMTPEEAASTQAFVSFMEKYELELTEVGLINSGDILSDNYLKTIGKAGEVMSLTRSIINQNRKWMGEQVEQLNKKLEGGEARQGLSRKEIIDYIQSPGHNNNNLAFHITNTPEEIMESGFDRGGMTIKTPHFDFGYGEYIAVFDITDIKKRFDVKEDEDLGTIYRGRSMEPEHDSEFAERMYGEANFAMKDEKPVAVVHLTEVPEFQRAMGIGARAEERDITGHEAIEEMLDIELKYHVLTNQLEKIPEVTRGYYGETLEEVQGAIEQARKELASIKTYPDYNLKNRTKQDILDDLNYKYNVQGLSESQLKLREDLTREIAELTERKKYFENLFEEIESASTIDDLAALGPKLDLTDSMAATLGDLSAQLSSIRGRIDNAVEILNKSRSGRVKRNHFPRIFNRRAIQANRDGLKEILMKFFRENPEMISQGDDGLLKTVRMSTDPKDIELRAEQTIENIMGESDDDAIDAMFSGLSKSGPLISRRLNIPNHLIKDFIVTDVKEVMIGYTNRVAPKLEYHKRFADPKTGKLMPLEQRVDYYRTELRKAGVPEKNIDRYIKNFVASYDRIVGTTLKRPDAIDTKAANFLRTATNWTFLGGSGVAALGDAASIFMDHELNTLGKAFLGSMDDIDLKMSAKELKLAGEALEIIRGTTHLKYMESLSNDMFTKTMPDRLNNAFYIMNLLAPVTVAIKNMNGLLYGHSIIDYSMKLVDGTANKFEREFLARYNITPDLAKRISEMPHESSQGGLRLPNTEAWPDEDAVIAFRNALNSTVMNRVIMGTPADKPLMMDGVAYIPDHVAKLLPFDLPVDPRVQGYRRAESGLLALPFTFYSYTMGALSKITANHAAGAVRNRMTHAAAAMALGYTIVKVRTPSWAWDDMDFEDKVARSFDFSGLAAIYSDIGYRAIAMANEMGVESSFPIQPKFDGGTDKLGALVSLGGAPADWTYEVLSSASQMVTGDVQGGAKGLVKMTPFLTTVMTGDILKDMAMEATSVLPNRP